MNKDIPFRLVASKFTWRANSDQLDIYLPKEDGLLPSNAYSTLIVSVDQSTYDTVTWTWADGVVLDEIRFGPSYESVLGRESQ